MCQKRGWITMGGIHAAARFLLIWLGLVVLEVANCTLRTLALNPWLGERAGHVVSTLLLCLLLMAAALLTMGSIGPRSRDDLLWIGGFWLAPNVAFAFLAGHYLFRNPWSKLLADCNLLRGRIWSLILITTFPAPGLAAW
jgi:hypothetical protein